MFDIKGSGVLMDGRDLDAVVTLNSLRGKTGQTVRHSVGKKDLIWWS